MIQRSLYHLSGLSLALLLLAGCVQTEIVSELIPATLELSVESAGVLTGSTFQLEATLSDPSGTIQDATLNWSSTEPAIASVDNSGLVSGLTEGQTWIKVFAETARDSALVNVVATAGGPATVIIEYSSNEVEVGESINLSAIVQDLAGVTLSEPVSWSSSNPAVASVDAMGTVEGLAEGITQITASAAGIDSPPLEITVSPIGPDSRTGSFEGRGGYDVDGTVTLTEDGSGIRVDLGADFESSSGGAGLYVYLSSVDSGPLTGSNSFNAGMVSNLDGSSSYNADGVGINDFDYVVIYCEPFNLYFGIAELN